MLVTKYPCLADKGEGIKKWVRNLSVILKYNLMVEKSQRLNFPIIVPVTAKPCRQKFISFFHFSSYESAFEN
mgnify:CR=1 FL=1